MFGATGMRIATGTSKIKGTSIRRDSSTHAVVNLETRTAAVLEDTRSMLEAEDPISVYDTSRLSTSLSMI